MYVRIVYEMVKYMNLKMKVNKVFEIIEARFEEFESVTSTEMKKLYIGLISSKLQILFALLKNYENQSPENFEFLKRKFLLFKNPNEQLKNEIKK